MSDKEYTIVNDVSLAEKKEQEVAPEEATITNEIKPDVSLGDVNKEEVTTPETPDITSVPTVEIPTPEIPAMEMTTPEIPVVDTPLMDTPQIPIESAPSLDVPVQNTFEAPVYNDVITPNYNMPSSNFDIDSNSKVFKNEEDVDNFKLGLTNDINKAVEERAINPMKETVKINKALLTWGRQVVASGLNKTLFEEFDRIEEMYNNIETATYGSTNDIVSMNNSEVSNTIPMFGNPTFQDENNQNDLGGMNRAA